MKPKPNPRVANGHRARRLRAYVLAEETHCALCGHWVDQTLTIIPGAHGPRCTGTTRAGEPCPGCVPHPHGPEVDHTIPVTRGGDLYARETATLMHRECNRWKSNRTLAEARRALAADSQPNAPTEPPLNTAPIDGRPTRAW